MLVQNNAIDISAKIFNTKVVNIEHNYTYDILKKSFVHLLIPALCNNKGNTLNYYNIVPSPISQKTQSGK